MLCRIFNFSLLELNCFFSDTNVYRLKMAGKKETLAKFQLYIGRHKTLFYDKSITLLHRTGLLIKFKRAVTTMEAVEATRAPIRIPSNFHISLEQVSHFYKILPSKGFTLSDW